MIFALTPRPSEVAHAEPAAHALDRLLLDYPDVCVFFANLSGVLG